MLTIVKPCVDPETIKTLTKLLQDAKDGRVIGLAYVALCPLNEYKGDVVGTAKDTPLLVRGLCRALEDVVTKLVG